MIAMGMGDENVRDGFAAHGIEQRRDMGIVIGAGIEDRDFAAADDVTHRALEGERARIIGDHRAHAGRDLRHRVGLEIESLVERDVVAHASKPCFIGSFSFVQPKLEPDRLQTDLALAELRLRHQLRHASLCV